MKSIVFVLFLTALLYTNCDQFLGEFETSTSSKRSCNTNVAEALRKPQTIDQVVWLINALPKPLDVYCVVEALKPPLKIYAVNNFASAQPSAGEESPRIFILNDGLILSVVPAGEGRNLLELAQRVSATTSVKGEIEFPIRSSISPDTPYSKIAQGPSGTSCLFCHGNEKPYPSITTGPAFESGILAPNFINRIRQPYLKNQTMICDPNLDEFRCKMLNAIFEIGQAQDAPWPQ